MEEVIPLEVVEERNEDDVINVPEVITNTHSIENLNLLEGEEEQNEDDAINVPEGIIDTHPMEELNLLEAEEEWNEDDGINAREYLEIINSPSFELKREKIEIESLLGSGNFGVVYKATLDNDTVAVKSLKGKTFHITLSLWERHPRWRWQRKGQKVQTVLVCLMSEIKLYLRVTIPFVRKYKTKPFVGIKVIIITRQQQH